MTPDLKYKQYVLNKLVSDLEGFLVYYNPQFKSWWWINPDTKEWRFEFKDSGTLYWFYGWGDNFMFKYSLEESEFVEVISRYVEHTLQNGVINTYGQISSPNVLVEHTLQNGVKQTLSESIPDSFAIEDTLQTGVVNARNYFDVQKHMVEHTLQNRVVNTRRNIIANTNTVEHILQNGVVHTAHIYSPLGDRVEHTLQNGSIINQ